MSKLAERGKTYADLTEAIAKVRWSATNGGLHPTGVCHPRRAPLAGTVDRASCTCGFWDALDLVRASEFGQLIRSKEYPR